MLYGVKNVFRVAVTLDCDPIWEFQFNKLNDVLFLKVVTAFCLKLQTCIELPAEVVIWMPISLKESLYGGLLIELTCIIMFALVVAAVMVRYCCCKFVVSEHGKVMFW